MKAFLAAVSLVALLGSARAQVVFNSPERGPAGTAGANGTNGAPGVNAYAAPATRAVSLATAYQCNDPTTPCNVTLNLTSTASFSLIGGTTNTADILVGPTSAVASGTGAVVGKYANSSTAGVAVGIGVTGIQGTTVPLYIPTGYYFAVRQTAGAVAITSAFDQKVG